MQAFFDTNERVRSLTFRYLLKAHATLLARGSAASMDAQWEELRKEVCFSNQTISASVLLWQCRSLFICLSELIFADADVMAHFFLSYSRYAS